LPKSKSCFQGLTTAHRWRFFVISAKNLLTSGVAFGYKAGKLPTLMNVKCCCCLFCKFSPLSDNNTYVIKCTIIIPTSKIHEVWFIIKLRLGPQTVYAHALNAYIFAYDSATTWLIICNACSGLFSFWLHCIITAAIILVRQCGNSILKNKFHKEVFIFWV
jgi:hypothetical protein